MFNFFRRKNHKKKGDGPKPIQMADIDGVPLSEGDLVMSLRYELGKCKIVRDEHQYLYESLESGERVSYLKMIDAATSFQKVRKLSDSSEG